MDLATKVPVFQKTFLPNGCGLCPFLPAALWPCDNKQHHMTSSCRLLHNKPIRTFPAFQTSLGVNKLFTWITRYINFVGQNKNWKQSFKQHGIYTSFVPSSFSPATTEASCLKCPSCWLHLKTCSGKMWNGAGVQRGTKPLTRQSNTAAVKSSGALQPHSGTDPGMDTSPDGGGAALSYIPSMQPTSTWLRSTTFISAEKNKSLLEKEVQALIFAGTNTRDCLLGRTSMLKTDHEPLIGVFEECRPNPTTAAAKIQCCALMVVKYSS